MQCLRWSGPPEGPRGVSPALCAAQPVQADPGPQGPSGAPCLCPAAPAAAAGGPVSPPPPRGPRQKRRPAQGKTVGLARQSGRGLAGTQHLARGTAALPGHSLRATSSGENLSSEDRAPQGGCVGSDRPVAAPHAPPTARAASRRTLPFLCPPGPTLGDRESWGSAPPSLSWKNNGTVRPRRPHREPAPALSALWGPERAGGPRQGCWPLPAAPPGAWTAPVHLHVPLPSSPFLGPRRLSFVPGMALLGMFKRQGSGRPQSGARAILMSCVDSPNLTSSRSSLSSGLKPGSREDEVNKDGTGRTRERRWGKATSARLILRSEGLRCSL